MSTVISALVADYPAIISEMPTPFSAHQFIQRLTQKNQALYIEALYQYKDSAQPFQVVHQQLGSHLHDFDALVKRIGEVSGADIFGKISTVSQWKKL